MHSYFLLFLKYLSISNFLVLVFFLFSCTQGNVPIKTEQSATQVPSKEEKLASPETEWEKVLVEARKEGRVVVYGIPDGELRSNLMRILKSRYGLELEWITGRAAELTPKLLNERRAGIFSADVYIGGAGSIVNDLIPQGLLDPFPKLLLPEVLDSKVWLNGQLTFVDKRKMALAMVANPSPPFYFNTSLVKPGEVNSYRDLLNPKWMRKIIINDPTTPGSAQFWFAIANNIMGTDYMRQLARTEPTVTRDQRLQVEWLAHGKFPIAIAAQTTTMTEFKKAGATLDQFTPIEGTHLTSSSGNIALVNKAPHLKAAQVFINWMLTKEAQTVYSQVTGHQSARIDIPLEHMDQDKVRQAGVKYFSAIDEDFLKTLPEHARIAKEIFGPFLK